MDRERHLIAGCPPEITKLDARIAREGGASSTLDMLPASLQRGKPVAKQSSHGYIRDLVYENDYLRQEIVYYKESREAMLAFHQQTLKSFQVLQTALKELSDKMARSEEFMLRYWGIDVNNANEDDLVVL